MIISKVEKLVNILGLFTEKTYQNHQKFDVQIKARDHKIYINLTSNSFNLFKYLTFS